MNARVYDLETPHGELLVAILHEHHQATRPAFAVPINPTIGSGVVVPGAYDLMGWTLRNGAAAQTVNVFDGETDGLMLAAIQLSANGAATQWLGPTGIEVQAGIVFQNFQALTNGSLYVRRRRVPLATDR